MTTPPLIELERIIPSLLSPKPSEGDLRDFVYYCRNLAHSYLKTKVNRGKLDPAQFGIPLEDLALDCVAPLFARNDRGRFVELARYFGTRSLLAASREELFGATRRLVFSKVSEELYRLYREHDPSLSHIIRNIKIALRFSRTMIPVVQNNELWVQPYHTVHPQEGTPLLPSEIIEARLAAHLGQRYTLPHILQCIGEILEGQDLYQKRYPLIGLAIVIRSLMVHSQTSLHDEDAHPELELSSDEIHQFIRTSIRKTRSAMKGSYIGNGKLNEKTFDTYFDCVQEILESEYTTDGTEDLSYFEVVQKRVKNLTAEEYKATHRVYLEYLVRLTRLNFLESVKEELQSA